MTAGPSRSVPETLLMDLHGRARINAHLQSVYPDEGCGLLIGRDTERGVLVTEVVPADNVMSPGASDRFELDPAARIAAEKRLRGTDQRLVGHFHSHPDGMAIPSMTDLDRAEEPHLAWVIVAVEDGVAVEMGAFALDRTSGRIAAIALGDPDTETS